MNIQIKVDNSIKGNFAKISKITIDKIAKTRKFKIDDSFPVGDWFEDKYFIVNVSNNVIEHNVLFVSKQVKSNFYLDKIVLEI